MSVSGDAYIPVQANRVRSNLTIGISGGGPIVGGDEFGIRISWYYGGLSANNGISGHGWFINEAFSPVHGLASSDDEFDIYLDNKYSTPAEIKEYLDGLFEAWPDSEKIDFYNAHIRYANEVPGCTEAYGI